LSSMVELAPAPPPTVASKSIDPIGEDLVSTRSRRHLQCDRLTDHDTAKATVVSTDRGI
jgi:hypothetical protein